MRERRIVALLGFGLAVLPGCRRHRVEIVLTGGPFRDPYPDSTIPCSVRVEYSAPGVNEVEEFASAGGTFRREFAAGNGPLVIHASDVCHGPIACDVRVDGQQRLHRDGEAIPTTLECDVDLGP